MHYDGFIFSKNKGTGQEMPTITIKGVSFKFRKILKHF
jgi:hypothetical protein